MSEGTPAGGNVEAILRQLGDREVRLHATAAVAERRVGDRTQRPAAVHSCGTQPVGCLHGLGALEEELAEVGLVEDRDAGARGDALLPDEADVLAPAEGAFALDQLVVLVLGMRLGRLAPKAADCPLIGGIKVVVLAPCSVALGETGVKPPWAFEALPALVHAALGQELLVERGAAGLPACERLVMREDDGVGLGIGLVRPILHPPVVVRRARVEARDVHGEEVDLRGPVDDPGRHLAAYASAEHHTHGIEAATVYESPEIDIRAHERLVVRREGLRTADGALDPQRLDQGATLDVPLEILVEGVPI
mmetsp:Transcript_56409/g.167906  ORF Transcript_56409/g.167906 Transcript_56409/m.167906 type:complete len:307 (+) Transcript_56409:1049-1969(+)